MTTRSGSAGHTFARYFHSAIKPLTVLAMIGCGAMSQAFAGTIEPTTYTWTGEGENSYLYTSGNWENETAPSSMPVALTSNITDIDLFFGDAWRTYLYYGELYASQITISGNTQSYYLDGDAKTTHIGSGGIVYAPAKSLWSGIGGPIQLHASQTWNIDSGTLYISSSISDQTDAQTPAYGNYEITKTGAGTLVLSSAYSINWAGGLRLSEGIVAIPSDGASTLYSLGTGTLTFDGGTLGIWSNEYSNGDEAIITNNIVSNGLMAFNNDYQLSIENTQSGDNYVRLDADTTLQVKGASMYVEKDITDNGGNYKLTVDSTDLVVLLGASNWSGGTQVTQGGLIFGGSDNLPGTTDSIVVASDGYVGIGVDNDVAQFLVEVDLANSTGSIGFDSDPEVGTDSFSTAIDLTGANASLRLGSATTAVLDTPAVITPQGTDYRFGGGGGTLIVDSVLTDSVAARNVIAESPVLAPLTLVLSNPTNSFTGTVTAIDSAIIFDDGIPLPAGTANFIMNSGGYIGTADTSISVSTFMSHFASDTVGIIGFDTAENATSHEISDLSMSGFSSAYVGTATAVYDVYGDISGPGLILSGTIGANPDGVHRFAAFKGGALQISGTLTGDSAIIGIPGSLGAFGDRSHDERSIVYMSGDNTGGLTNGVTLYSGELIVGQGAGTLGTDPSTALGSGTLTIESPGFAFDEGGMEGSSTPEPLLTAADTDLIISNSIVLNNGLQIGSENDITLSGNISGSGQLHLGDEDYTYTTTLAGTNTFTGGIELGYGATVNFATDSAAGMGALDFDYEGVTAVFTSLDPIVYGLEGDASYVTIQLSNEASQTLTIYQQEKGSFNGSIYSGGSVTFIKDGSGLLNFDSAGIYSSGIADGLGNNVSLEVRSGTLVLSNNSYVTGGTVKVTGGTLALGGDTYLYNPVVVSSGGRIAGYGVYDTSISIGAGAMLSPGLAEKSAIGLMSISHLELNSGGIYEYNVQDPDPTNIYGQDRISVRDFETLVINSTAGDPFIIKVISLDANGDPGTLTGVDQGYGLYSWVLFDYNSLSIPGTNDIFDASLFSLDLSEFTSDAALGGDFNLYQEGNQIILGFTPVPEPSTYALMALGLGFIAWTIRRRRRSAR